MYVEVLAICKFSVRAMILIRKLQLLCANFSHGWDRKLYVEVLGTCKISASVHMVNLIFLNTTTLCQVF